MVTQGGKAENFEKSGYKTRTEEIQRPRPLKTEDGATAWLEQIDRFIHGQFDVAQDGAQQARTERFASVHGDSGRSAVRVFEKYVTTARPINREAGFLERADNLSSLRAGKTRHTESC